MDARAMAIEQDRLLSELRCLPSLPYWATQLVETTESLRAPLAAVAAVVEKDIGLAAKALRLANSSLYGKQGRVDSLLEAADTLGISALRRIAFGALLISSDSRDPRPGPISLWRHSICCAIGARSLARELAAADADTVFAAALLHDIGKLVALRSTPHTFRRIAERWQGGALPFREAERLVLGTDHTYIGARICDEWQLPPVFAACAQYHHLTHTAPDSDRDIQRVVTLVHLGNWIAGQVLNQIEPSPPQDPWLGEFQAQTAALDHASDEVESELQALDLTFYT